MSGQSQSVSPLGRVCMAVLALLLVLTGIQFGTLKAEAAGTGGKIIVGYWHNFDNYSTNIKLRDISPDYDVIQVAFAEPVGGSQTGNMAFVPYNATVSEFQADVAFLQARGQKVLISIGGANGKVELTTAGAKQTFVTTMKSIIDLYGFNGFDIDLEGSSLALNAGDTDFKNPTSPKITNLIAASRDILSAYGPDFLLTMAPETAYVQGAISGYGGIWGAYLPVIYALRNDLDYLHVQHYNSGSMLGLDGRSYSQGTSDFQVAMAEMLLQGFPIGNNPNNMFPALRQDQIVIGLPSSPQAAGGGYTTPANVQKALDYLIKGQSYGGSYVLRNPAGYPDFKGLMTWSINWDKFTNYQFSTSHRAYLNQYGGGGNPDITPPTVPANVQVTGQTSTGISLSWQASTDDRGVTGYTVYYTGGQTTVSGTSATVSGLLPQTTYTFTVKARDAAGNLSASSASVSGTTNPPARDDVAPTVPGNLRVVSKSSYSVALAWDASTDNVGVASYAVTYGNTSLNTTATNLTVSSLSPNTTYTFNVKAIDTSGNQSAASSPLTVITEMVNSCIYQPYNATTAYSGGMRIIYDGNIYEAKWWTRGEIPNPNSTLGPWKLIGPCGDTDMTPPTAPANLSVTAVYARAIYLSWSPATDNVGVTGYTVSYGTNSVNVTGTTAMIMGLAPNTEYTFTVKAKDQAGNVSAASNAVTQRTTMELDVNPPTVPSNLQATSVTSNSVTLSWGPSSDNVAVIGYLVNNGSTTVTSQGTSFVVSGLAAGTTYTFSVKAFDAAGNESNAATVQATTSTSTGPAAWAANVSYKVGDVVSYGGKTYSCRQPHTSLTGWEPTNVPALWNLV
ncbi:fibronectin type III domain-containing protein [Paenibacillus sp. GCM10027627]|uniref:fibronectin type III domain-containing protein n=1 Tax=unclassified Paenibacillus TaxID=185978 RepID=UPI00362967D2